jgi:hypothetical protein
LVNDVAVRPPENGDNFFIRRAKYRERMQGTGKTKEAHDSCESCASFSYLSMLLFVLRPGKPYDPLGRLLKNPRMSRCCQFSEDRKEPSAGRSRNATGKLGDTARAENWRNPEGVSSRVTYVGFSTVS